MKFSDASIINAQYQYFRIDILGQCLFSKGKTLSNNVFEVLGKGGKIPKTILVIAWNEIFG
jgi:hypothetical protein